MPRTIKVYKLSEIKKLAPDAYARIHEKWKEHARSDSPPWTGEIMASLKATVKACGARLDDWSIGAYSPSYVRVTVEEEENEETGETIPHDATWFVENVLRPNKYPIDAKGVPSFPGICPFTGYCADEDMVESVYNDLAKGRSMKDALENLARKASKLMEEDAEQWEEEENMVSNWGDNEYTIDGRRV